jgi:signal transduction histidine kinase
LKKILPSLRNNARVDCLNELCGSYLVFNSPIFPVPKQNIIGDTAVYYANQAYTEAIKTDYTHGIAESLSYKGEILILSQNYPAEEKLSREAITWYKKTTNKKRLAETYFYLSHALYSQSRFTEAIKNLDTAFELHKRNENINGMYWTVFLACWVYNESGDYEKAFETARRCLDIATQIKKEGLRRRVLGNIGWLFMSIGDYKTALEYYRESSKNIKLESLDFAELFTLMQQYDSAKYYYNLADTTDQKTLRSYLTITGEYFFAQKRYESALANFIRVLLYHRQVNDINQVTRTLLDIAKTYLAIGNNDSAYKYGIESLVMTEQTRSKRFIPDAYKILSSVYDLRHQLDSAYFYYRQYITMRDSVQNNMIKGKLAAYTFEQKMELLNKEKQLQQVQLQNQSVLKNILITSMIILLLLAAAIFRNIILKRRYEKQRLEQKLELQQLESKIESQQALLNERLRISRELHDDIGSTLGSISIYSEVAKSRTEKNENTNEVLSKIGLTSRELIDKVSDIVWSLNPNNESFEQLQNRMLAFAAMILAPRNIQYDFIADEDLKKMQFKGEQLKNIFLIFKEALYNIVKYADCKTAHITMSLKNDNLLMTVRDDGKGFDTSQLTMHEISEEHEYLGGNGMKNMHSRADDLNAGLCIHSTINEGTTVELTLPI